MPHRFQNGCDPQDDKRVQCLAFQRGRRNSNMTLKAVVDTDTLPKESSCFFTISGKRGMKIIALLLQPLNNRNRHFPLFYLSV